MKNVEEYFKNKVMLPGEKIKQIREFFKISQQKICVCGISQSHLSLIEAGKRKLYEEQSDIIVSRINKSLAWHEYEVTKEWLLKSIAEQLQGSIEFLSVVEIENTINKYENHLDKNELYNIFFSLAGQLRKDSQFNAAVMYLDRCISIALGLNDTKKLVAAETEKIRVNYKLGNFRENINSYEKLMYIIKDKELSEFLDNISFNIALSYYYINDFNRSLDMLNKIKVEEDFKKADINILKGSCLYNINKTKEAIDILNYTLKDLIVTEHQKSQIFQNLIYFTYKTDQYKKSLKYYRKFLRHSLTTDNSDMDIAFNWSMLIFIELNKKDYIKKNYKKLINSCKNINEDKFEFDVVNSLIEYFIREKMSEELKIFTKMLCEKMNLNLEKNKELALFIRAFTNIMTVAS